jgi:quinol monooxygenase YgiN
MSITRSSPSVHQKKWPKSKPVITIDVFKVSREQVDDLWHDWNDLVREIFQDDNVNSINLYQNLSHNQTQWILQIEWKSESELKQALYHGDFQEFQKFLNKWKIAISQQQKYAPQAYRRFTGINFDQAISTQKRCWTISSDFLMVIAFLFGIAAALVILILR